MNVAVMGQHFPYTPIANPRHLVEGWSFGIRPGQIQANVDAARQEGAEIVVLLSHNGFDVDRKVASTISGIDVILTGHTHDAIPQAIKIKTPCYCRQDHMVNSLAGLIWRLRMVRWSMLPAR